MQLNIIHLLHRKDRLLLLHQQLQEQNITNYKIWNGIEINSTPQKNISQAHKQIVRYAQQHNLPQVLIAEDDLRFTDKGAFQFFLKNKPIDFDIYLASIYYGKIKKDNTVKDFSGTTFYILNQSFYSTFLSVDEDMHLDRSLNNLGKYVVCNPFTVIQHNGYSDNLKRNCNYDLILADKDLFKLS